MNAKALLVVLALATPTLVGAAGFDRALPERLRTIGLPASWVQRVRDRQQQFQTHLRGLGQTMHQRQQTFGQETIACNVVALDQRGLTHLCAPQHRLSRRQ